MFMKVVLIFILWIISCTIYDFINAEERIDD